MNFKTAKSLLSCPFCGGQNYINDENEEYTCDIEVSYNSFYDIHKNKLAGYQVLCNWCKGSTGFYWNEQDAIKAWNRIKR